MSKHLNKSIVSALICALLFFVLSPGVLLTIPPKCEGKVFLAMKDDVGCATSYSAAVVHAIIFGLLCFVCCYFLK